MSTKGNPMTELDAARKRLEEALRPIIGLEYRTPKEVFDMMSDRIRFAVAMLDRLNTGGGDE